jgi:hypothetical protein
MAVVDGEPDYLAWVDAGLIPAGPLQDGPAL